MIKTDLLKKVLLAFQNLDGWQDSVLEYSILDAWNNNLHLIASLVFDTNLVKIDIDIYDENIDEYAVEIEEVLLLDTDVDTNVGLILDFLQTQIEYARDAQ